MALALDFILGSNVFPSVLVVVSCCLLFTIGIRIRLQGFFPSSSRLGVGQGQGPGAGPPRFQGHGGPGGGAQGFHSDY